jgi:hypothetical protein
MAALIVVGVTMKDNFTNENHKIVNGNLVITAKKKEKNTRQHVLRLKLKKNFNMVILKLEQNYQLGMASGLFLDVSQILTK